MSQVVPEKIAEVGQKYLKTSENEFKIQEQDVEMGLNHETQSQYSIKASEHSSTTPNESFFRFLSFGFTFTEKDQEKRFQNEKYNPLMDYWIIRVYCIMYVVLLVRILVKFTAVVVVFPLLTLTVIFIATVTGKKEPTI